MKAIIPNLDTLSTIPMYIQLYQYIQNAIISNDLVENEKLPSLRNLASSLDISITTVDLAYSQLVVEGYIYSKPNSGYYVNPINQAKLLDDATSEPPTFFKSHFHSAISKNDYPFYSDSACFNFTKWKKSINKVFNEYSDLLLFEADSQGERPLRIEIAKYLFSSRGVECNPNQIVISAGTQQTTSLLSKILYTMNRKTICLESPGYIPVSETFTKELFNVLYIPVKNDGIDIARLPNNIPSTVYINPSNQFPTGAIMPIGNRIKLLEWAKDNDSFIIEDDYDSELRYFGRPIPALQSLDKNERVVYLGSFSSTLYPAIKISYMVLPKPLLDIWQNIKVNYTQTCSKVEQLALALFMQDGSHLRNIKKIRRLYSQKLNLITKTMKNLDTHNKIQIYNKYSGITLLMSVHSYLDEDTLLKRAKACKLNIVSSEKSTKKNLHKLIFYYNNIPLEKIEYSIKQLLSVWEIKNSDEN